MNIYGRNVHCPACGAGLADVDPNYRLLHDDEDWSSVMLHRGRVLTQAHCTNGHPLKVETVGGEKFAILTVAVRFPPEDWP